MVAVGSAARRDTRDHVASAGPRQCAPPASAFTRSEVPVVPQALLFSTPCPILCVSNSREALLVVADALVGVALCRRPSRHKVRANGPSRLWVLVSLDPGWSLWAPEPPLVEPASHPSGHLRRECTRPGPRRLPRLIWFVFVGSWAAPPASAGLKTLLPVPAFEGESICPFHDCKLFL